MNYTPLPWKADRNTARETGWFIRQDIPLEELRGISQLDGSPVYKPSPGITSFQIYMKEDAEFIVLACNSYHCLRDALEELLACTIDGKTLDVFDEMRVAWNKAMIALTR